MPRGGYQRPSNPAPVSNPGSGRRTDGGPTQAGRYIAGGQYGEGRQLMGLQQAAPMAAASPLPSMSKTATGLSPIVPLTAPTQRPEEPLTAGMPFGAGPGVEALGANSQSIKLSDTLAQVVREDPSGQAAELYEYLLSRGL